jgi:hypothetical protein
MPIVIEAFPLKEYDRWIFNSMDMCDKL